MPHLQRGASARMGRSVGILRRQPRRLRRQPRRENAVQTGGEEMQELWHMSRTHCWCQQTNPGYLHQWKDKFGRGQVRVQYFAFAVSAISCPGALKWGRWSPRLSTWWPSRWYRWDDQGWIDCISDIRELFAMLTRPKEARVDPKIRLRASLS